MYKVKMAFRSLVYRRRQYISLLAVTTLGIAVSALSVFVINGMIFSLEQKAKFYYGGDFMVWGGESGSRSLELVNVEGDLEKMRAAFPKNSVVTARYDFATETTDKFYFEGVSVIGRVIKGVDFAAEAGFLSQMSFTAGGAENLAGTNGILLSKLVAGKLNINVGDELTLLTKTEDGFLNTVAFVVRGIFADASLFGALTSYADIDFLREAVGVPRNLVNRICIRLPKGLSREKIGLAAQKNLERNLSMFPYEQDKYAFRSAKSDLAYDGYMYKLVPLRENLDDVKILIDAMRAVSLFIIAMLTIIISAGVSSTFRVIVMRRINEIGIYMSLGMRRAEIAVLILCETALLVLFGSVLSLLLSAVLMRFVSQFHLSFIPAFDLFLSNGVLVPQFSLPVFSLIASAVCVTTLAAVLFSIRKSVGASPVKALGTME